jgi:hypothetical protein
MATTSQAMDSRMTSEVCGNIRHSGNYCPATQEDEMFMNGNNNSYRPQEGQTWNQSRPYYQGGNQGNSFNSNQHSLRDLVFGQAKINDGFNKKIVAYDKALESFGVFGVIGLEEFLAGYEFWWTITWLWSAHEVLLLSPKSCSDPWSELGDRELDLEELTHGFCSSQAAQVTPV